MCVCVCVCVCLRSFTLKASSAWNSRNVRKQICDVVLKTFLFTAKSLQRYVSTKYVSLTGKTMKNMKTNGKKQMCIERR